MKKIENKILFNIPPNSKKCTFNFTKLTKSQELIPNYNIGILTGEKNGITVLDIDTSDCGMQVYLKWMEDPMKLKDLKKCYKVRTPSGGIHIYFKYNDLLKNDIRVNDYGVDLKNNNAYVLACGSKIDKRKYSYLEGVSFLEMPQWLIAWLLKPNKKITKEVNKPITLKFDKDLFIKLVDQLAKDKNNYSYFKWLHHTAFFKLYNEYDQWIRFCKLDKNYKLYKQDNNIKLWNSADVNKISNNYSFKVAGIEVNYYKHIDLLENCNIDKIINKEYLDEEMFKNKDSVMVKSATGTGKTTSFLDHMKKTENKFIIITVRRSLADDVYKKCKESKIKCRHYSKDKYYTGNNLIIQLDSLLKIETWIHSINEYCLYLDEINSLITYLNTSTTLKNKRFSLYVLFRKMIKNCKKLILTDSDITFLTYNFINNIRPVYFIFNECKKWINTNVTILNQTKILKLLEKDKSYKHVIFDSKSLANAYKEKLTDSLGEIIVYDGDSKYIDNPDDWIENVFFTPTITTGVDVSNREKSIYAFFKGHTIDPATMYQMITRARKIKNVYICFLKNKINQPKYRNIEHVKLDILENLNLYQELLNNHNIVYYNETLEKYTIYENTFYKSYCDYLYINDAFNTNKKQWLINILSSHGMTVIDDENSSEINNDINFEISDLIKDIKNINKDNYKYDKNDQLIKLLNLTKHNYKKYIDVLVDQNKLEKHFNLSKEIKTFRQNKKDISKSDEFKILKMTDNTSKLLVKQDFEKILKCHLFNLYKFSDLDNEKFFNITTQLINNYKKLFRYRGKPIQNKIKGYDLMSIYIKIVKQLFGSDIVKNERKTKNNDRYRVYKLNEEYMDFHIKLYYERNDDYKSRKRFKLNYDFDD